MKKNVLIVAYDGMNKSGVPGVIMEIINGLNDAYNFSLVVFENIENHFYYNRLKELNIEIIMFSFNEPSHKIGKFYKELSGFHKATYNFFNTLFKNKHFDCVHSFKEADSSGIFKAAKRNGIKLRIWHTNVIHKRENNLLGLIINHKLNLTRRLSSVYVGVSLTSCKNAFKKKDFKVIHNCYNSDIYFYKPAGPFSNLDIVQIGYFSNNKNQLFTLEVCKILSQKFPTFKIHFIGYPNDKGYLKQVEDFVKKEFLQKNVLFHSYDSNQIDIFSKCSYSLMPSIREGFSLTLLEAQACGLKCVASTSIPGDANAGGVTYLELKPELWANYIIDDFKKTRGKHVYFDMEKYSRQHFLKNIKELYN